jgi:hypothetical protein
MQFKYDFTEYPSGSIPFVEILIINKDTGASIGYKEKVVFGGVEGGRQLTGKVAVITIMVMQKGKSHKFDAAVAFSDGVAKDGFAILGRNGFFW